MAGRLPYEAASLTDLARLQEAGAPPRLDLEARDVPPTLAAAVARALARDPRDRYADAAEMEDALRDGLAGIGGTADLDATRMLPPTEDATRMLDRTHAGPPTGARRRLQPIDEPPAPRRAPRAAPPPPAAAQGEQRRRQVDRARARADRAVAGGVLAYQALNGGGERRPQLNEDVGGTVHEAVDELQAARRGQHAMSRIAATGCAAARSRWDAVRLGEARELARGARWASWRARGGRRCATVPPRMPSQSASSESTWSVSRTVVTVASPSSAASGSGSA